MSRELAVLLTTEGTYPAEQGGVSTWCDLLLRRIGNVRYTLLSVMAHPYLPARYSLPPAVTEWIKVPLWGTEDPSELLNLGSPELIARRQRTTDALVTEQFVPRFERIVEQIWSSGRVDGHAVAEDLAGLHQLFQEYDYQAMLKHPAVWDRYCSAVAGTHAPRHGLAPTLKDLSQSLGWLYRFLAVLAVPIPAVDLTHASAAAFCALPGVVAKRLRKTPLLVTEHGVYLREQYNSIGQSRMSAFSRAALMRLVRLVSQTVYDAADVLAPVAEFNARWERETGVEPQRIRVIYNGVDPNEYRPQPRPEGAPPTVVSLARIDPVKDLATLLHAAVRVREEVPAVRFVIYGSVTVPAYYEELLRLRSDLGLAEAVIFAGHHPHVGAACASGDVVALTSVSEGFPYSVIEAMMCARPVVATDVGGVREALAETGILVPPRAPAELAAAIVRLLGDGALAQAVGAAACERARAHFSVGGFLQKYRDLYQELGGGGQ